MLRAPAKEIEGNRHCKDCNTSMSSSRVNLRTVTPMPLPHRGLPRAVSVSELREQTSRGTVEVNVGSNVAAPGESRSLVNVSHRSSCMISLRPTVEHGTRLRRVAPAREGIKHHLPSETPQLVVTWKSFVDNVLFHAFNVPRQGDVERQTNASNTGSDAIGQGPCKEGVDISFSSSNQPRLASLQKTLVHFEQISLTQSHRIGRRSR